MPFQIRNFLALPQEKAVQYIQNKKKNWFQQTFPDIYVFKQSNPHIGVKFRDIEVRKYGYKIKSVELKIDILVSFKNIGNLDAEHFRFYQDWKKYEIYFKYKLLSPKFFKNEDKIQKQLERQIIKFEQQKRDYEDFQEEKLKFDSYQSQLLHLNKKLIQQIKKYLSKKPEMKQYLDKQSFLNKWLDKKQEIKQLYLIRKKKQKSWSWESGVLSIQKFSEKRFKINKQNKSLNKLVFMDTVSAQSREKCQIQQYINKEMLVVKDKEIDKNQKNDFEYYYKSKDKEGQLIKDLSKNYKFKYNSSYPQLLEDLHKHLH